MTRPRRCAGAVVVAACVVLATAPNVQAARLPSLVSFDVIRGTGSEKVTFVGDGSPGCVSSGRCGDTGTITYTFDVRGGLAFFLERGGFASLQTSGATNAAISRGSTQCADTVAHKEEDVIIDGTKVLFHPGGELSGVFADVLSNRCGGPLEADVIGGDDALLTGRLPSHPERRRTLHIAMSTSRPFAASGFTGTVDASVTLELRRSR